MEDFTDAVIEILGQLLRPEVSIFELLTNWGFRNSFYSLVFTSSLFLLVGGFIYIIVTEDPLGVKTQFWESLQFDFTSIRALILAVIIAFLCMCLALSSAKDSELVEILAGSLFHFLIFFKLGEIYGAFKVGEWGGEKPILFMLAFLIASALSFLSFIIDFFVPFVAILAVSSTTFVIFQRLRHWKRLNIVLVLGIVLLIGLSSTVDYEIENLIYGSRDIFTIATYKFLSFAYILALFFGVALGALRNRLLPSIDLS